MSRPTTPRSPESTAGESEKQEASKPAEASQENTNNKPNEADQSLSNPRTVALLISVFLSMFLVAMDRTIISTAIPRITDDFNSLPDVGWYGSIYLLTCCAFQLLFGKLYAFYPVKVVLLTSILLFEISSAICGAAPNSTAFIVGRAISGVGAAGIFAGTIVSIVHAVPLNKRPKLQGMMGAVMGVTTVIGPLIGGAFTSNVTWRWCFYINLPFGAVAMFVIAFFYQFPGQGARGELPWKKKLAQLDAPGTTLLIPGVVCILLALQWGGQTYAWSNARIIVLLTVGGVLFIGFMGSQVLFHQTATIPPRILKYRSVAAGLWSTLCIGASQYIFIYYLPIWFQSIKGVEPVNSGIRLLPLMLGMITASIGGGFLNQKIGYYTPFGIAGTCLMSVGAGLITTFQAFGTGSNKWIGYQVLYGFGMGLCFQTPNLATQTVLPKKDAPMGLALMFFGQLLGAAVFVSVGQNVLDNELLKRLAKIGIPGFDKSLVTSGGATTLLEAVPPELRSAVLIAYNEALRKVFQIGLIISCLTILGTGSMEWKNILKKRAEEEQNSKKIETEENKEEEKKGEGKKGEETA